MRYVLIFLAVCLMAPAVYAQDIWSFPLDIPYSFLVRDLVPGTGTSVRFVGSGPTQAMAGEVDTNGEVLWLYEWESSGDNWSARFNSAVALPEQHLLVAGGEFFDDGEDYDWHSTLRHLDDQGNLVEYISPTSHNILNAVDTNDAGIFVSGEGFDPYLARIGRNGTILNESSMGQDIILAHPSGNVMIGGGLMRYMSETLSQVWSLDLQFISACLSHQNDFIILANDHVVHRIDVDGNVVWSSQILEDALVITPYLDSGYIVVAPPADFTLLNDNGEIETIFADTSFHSGWIQDVVCDDTGLIATIRSSGEVILARLPGAVNLSIDLIPSNNQDPIPPPGGVLFFSAICENYTPTVFTGNAWTNIRTPGGMTIPIQVFDLTLWPYQQLQTSERNLLIPYFAPPGLYYLKAALGTYPNQIATADSFAFYKSPWPLGQEPVEPFVGCVEANEDETKLILR